MRLQAMARAALMPALASALILALPGLASARKVGGRREAPSEKTVRGIEEWMGDYQWGASISEMRSVHVSRRASGWQASSRQSVASMRRSGCSAESTSTRPPGSSGAPSQGAMPCAQHFAKLSANVVFPVFGFEIRS